MEKMTNTNELEEALDAIDIFAENPAFYKKWGRSITEVLAEAARQHLAARELITGQYEEVDVGAVLREAFFHAREENGERHVKLRHKVRDHLKAQGYKIMKEKPGAAPKSHVEEFMDEGRDG